MQKPTSLARAGLTLAMAGLALTLTLTSVLTLSGCTTTSNAGKADDSAVRTDITQGYNSTLSRLYAQVNGSRELVAKASGVLIFPNVIAAGFVVGGEYGKGELRVKGKTDGYYSVGSVSVGFQAGAQSKAVVMLFMTQDALDKFRNSKGWTAGADASVALLKVGANGEIDTNSAVSPVQALVLTNAGLMANLNLEGTKITKLNL